MSKISLKFAIVNTFTLSCFNLPSVHVGNIINLSIFANVKVTQNIIQKGKEMRNFVLNMLKVVVIRVMISSSLQTLRVVCKCTCKWSETFRMYGHMLVTLDSLFEVTAF